MSQANELSDARVSARIRRASRRRLAAGRAAALSIGVLVPTLANAHPNARLIRPGDGCPESFRPGIRCVQSVLRDFTNHPGLAVDGCYGPQSQRAIYDLQRFWGLTPDRIVGPQTGDVIDTILKLNAPGEVMGWNMVCYPDIPTLD